MIGETAYETLSGTQGGEDMMKKGRTEEEYE